MAEPKIIKPSMVVIKKIDNPKISNNKKEKQLFLFVKISISAGIILRKAKRRGGKLSDWDWMT